MGSPTSGSPSRIMLASPSLLIVFSAVLHGVHLFCAHAYEILCVYHVYPCWNAKLVVGDSPLPPSCSIRVCANFERIWRIVRS